MFSTMQVKEIDRLLQRAIDFDNRAKAARAEGKNDYADFLERASKISFDSALRIEAQMSARNY